MKKLLYIFAALVAVAAIASCNKENPQPSVKKLTVVSSDLNFNSSGGSGTIVVEADGAVSASSEKPWATTSVSGNTITVNVGPWDKLESRSSKITVTCGNESADVVLLQRGTTLELDGLSIVDPVYLNGSSETYSFSYSSPSQLSAEAVNSWIGVQVSGDQIVITPETNPDKAVRRGSVRLTYGSVTVTIPIAQYPIFENTADWRLSFVEKKEEGEKVNTYFKNTVAADHGKYFLYYTTPGRLNNSGLSESDFVRDVLVDETAAIVWEKVASDNNRYSFGSYLSSETSTVFYTGVDDGEYLVWAVGFDTLGEPTGWYSVASVQVGEVSPYEKWLGEWTVPCAGRTDVWTVEPNVVDESYKVWGFGGFDKDYSAAGAFVAIASFDAETQEMVFKVYENTAVSWTDASRGAMNALLSGNYTNVAGSTYYTSSIGTVICRAKLGDDGSTATLTGGTVTSGGAPATFHNIRWYGRYTNSSGGKSAVSWSNSETAIPTTLTRKE